MYKLWQYCKHGITNTPFGPCTEHSWLCATKITQVFELYWALHTHKVFCYKARGCFHLQILTPTHTHCIRSIAQVSTERAHPLAHLRAATEELNNLLSCTEELANLLSCTEELNSLLTCTEELNSLLSCTEELNNLLTCTEELNNLLTC